MPESESPAPTFTSESSIPKGAPSEVTNQDRKIATDDLREYVDAFKASSDRARYALFAVVVTTVLVAIANYNFQPWGWPLSRIEAWYKYALVVDPRGQVTSIPAIPKEILGGDAERLKIAREEYVKQFIARSVFNVSPIPGVSVDENDLGILGGTALSLLMLVLVICVMREHENLYLALYKVRRLCVDNYSRGDSKANLLYHALAMSQSLSSPPTLARWKNRGILHHFGSVFFLPVLVYVWLLYINVKTKGAGEKYGVNMYWPVRVQIILAFVLMALTMTVWLFSRAMAKRWESAFFRINPSHQRLRQMSILEWVKLVPRANGKKSQNIMTEKKAIYKCNGA